MRGVFFLVVRPWIIHFNGFLRKRETRTPTFFFKFIFFWQNVNIFQIGLLSVQIDIFRRNSCYFSIYATAGLFSTSSDGFFLWSVSYLLSIITTSGMSWFRVGVCLEYTHFFSTMYNKNATTNTNEIFVVAVYTDTVSSVAEKKYPWV